MNILLFDFGSYIHHDLLYYLERTGHTCKTIYYHFSDKFEDDFFCNRFSRYLTSKQYDVVISANFFPLIAKLCYEYHTKYISWCYDSPLEEHLQDYFSYETNYIFLFDYLEVNEYRACGYNRIFHLPLAVNVARLDTLQFPDAISKKYQADISFVGHLYDSPLNTLLYSADAYTKGYIEGILQTQLRIYGYYFVDDMLTDELLNNLNSSFRSVGNSNILLNRRGLSYAIATQITHMERSFLIGQLGELYNTHFYTTEPCTFNTPVKVFSPVKYHTEMPAVFRYSKLNLNPTLKSIRSGIPLRALDIMGAKGVLFSNFQPELTEYFEPDKDFVMYESIEDAFDKADFYLKHDDLRSQIANNGYERVKTHFNYPQRIQEMFEIAQLQ